MPTRILPAASLSLPQERQTAPCCPNPIRASKHLICIPLWSIAWTIFRIASNFLPALREGASLPGGVEQGPGHRRPSILRGVVAGSARQVEHETGSGGGDAGDRRGIDGVRPAVLRQMEERIAADQGRARRRGGCRASRRSAPRSLARSGPPTGRRGRARRRPAPADRRSSRGSRVRRRRHRYWRRNGPRPHPRPRSAAPSRDGGR